MSVANYSNSVNAQSVSACDMENTGNMQIMVLNSTMNDILAASDFTKQAKT